MCNFSTTLVIFGNKIFNVFLGTECGLHFYEDMYILFWRWGITEILVTVLKTQGMHIKSKESIPEGKWSSYKV